MGEACHTTSGGVESHRLNLEREAWAATPPAILHYTQQNVSRTGDGQTLNTHRQASEYTNIYTGNTEREETICLGNRWEAAASLLSFHSNT